MIFCQMYRHLPTAEEKVTDMLLIIYALPVK